MTPEAAATPENSHPDWLSRLEWLVSGGVLVITLFLTVISALYAGGFWRDEANSVQMATWPGFRENWNAVWLDAHPVGYSLLLKPLLMLAGEQPAGWLRWVGAGVCLLCVGTLWTICRLYSHRPPLFAFAVVVLNPISIRFLSSLRPYGLVTWLLLLCLLTAARYSQRGGRLALATVFLTAFLCAQCLYTSVVPLVCLIFGLAWVTWRNRGRSAGLRLAGAGLLGAASVMIYLPALSQAHRWSDLQSFRNFEFLPFWNASMDLLEAGDTYLSWMWALILGAGLLLCLSSHPRDAESRLRTALLPMMYAALLGLIGVVIFARNLTAQWYFLPTFFLLAAALEINFSHLVRNTMRTRLEYLILTVLLCVVQFGAANDLLRVRQTNIDVVARQIAAEAGPGDLIVVVNPLHGVSFNLYYHGEAPWETIPPLQDHRIHRFDLIRNQINNPDALAPLLRAVTKTLQGGYRVYLVGAIMARDAPLDPRRVVDMDAYLQRWNTQLAFFLAEHAGSARYRMVETPNVVFRMEDPELIVVQGWR